MAKQKYKYVKQYTSSLSKRAFVITLAALSLLGFVVGLGTWLIYGTLTPLQLSSFVLCSMGTIAGVANIDSVLKTKKVRVQVTKADEMFGEVK